MNISAFIKNNKTQVMSGITIELLIIALLGFLLLWLSNTYILPNPSLPIFRIIGSIAQVLVLIAFLFIKQPSLLKLGLSYKEIKPKVKIYYAIGIALILLLLITSCLILDFFSFTINLRFGIVSPIFEEIIFRGYIWYRLKDNQYKDISVIIITGFLFGLFHLAGYYEISYSTSFFVDAPSITKILFNKILFNTGYGLLLGFVRYKSKNLYLSLIIHSIGNFLGK